MILGARQRVQIFVGALGAKGIKNAQSKLTSEIS
jgi:hypothetical protein